MKRTFPFLFMLIMLSANAQDTTAFTISKTVAVNSVSKEELLKRTKQWIDDSYYAPLNVLQLDDKANDSLVVKTSFSVAAENELMTRLEEGTVNYTLTFKCSDGICKYVLQDFVHEGGKGYGSGGNLNSPKPACGVFKLPHTGWSDIKRQSSRYINHLENSLQQALNNQPDHSKADKW